MDSTIHNPFKSLPDHARKLIMSLLCEKIAYLQVYIDHYNLTDEELNDCSDKLTEYTKLLYMFI